MNPTSLTQLRKYIVSVGWRLAARPDAFLEIWTLPGTNAAQLLLPSDEAIDPEFLLRTAFLRLAEEEGVPAVVVAERVATFGEELVSVRVKHDDVDDGTVPLDDGILLHEKARDLLVAASSAVLEKRGHFQGRPSLPIAALIKEARLGQSARGSYVVNVFWRRANSPEIADLAQATSLSLLAALRKLEEVLEAYEASGNTSHFEEAIHSGVSANLCEAILAFSGKERTRDVEIGVKPSGDGQLFIESSGVFSFPARNHELLQAASDYYKKNYILANETVTGVIERLERHENEESGKIRVAATLSNAVRRSVGAQLFADEYKLAIRAHELKRIVQVAGNVLVSPKAAYMLNPRDFKVLGNFDLFEADGFGTEV